MLSITLNIQTVYNYIHRLTPDKKPYKQFVKQELQRCYFLSQRCKSFQKIYTTNIKQLHVKHSFFLILLNSILSQSHRCKLKLYRKLLNGGYIGLNFDKTREKDKHIKFSRHLV